MITFVHMQLTIWAKAQMREARQGLGYASTCPMFKDARNGGGYGSAPPVGVAFGADRVSDMDAAIQRLGREDRILVDQFYRVGGSANDVAGRLGVSKKRMYELIDVLHARVLGLLNDVVAEVA